MSIAFEKLYMSLHIHIFHILLDLFVTSLMSFLRYVRMWFHWSLATSPSFHHRLSTICLEVNYVLPFYLSLALPISLQQTVPLALANGLYWPTTFSFNVSVLRSTHGKILTAIADTIIMHP